MVWLKMLTALNLQTTNRICNETVIFFILKLTQMQNKITVFFILSFLYSTFLYSQCPNGICGPNLLPNPNFETTSADCANPATTCIMYFNTSKVQDWWGTVNSTDPPPNTPDYKNPSCVASACNSFGTACSGNGHVWLASGNYEYIQAQLVSPLQPNINYCFTFSYKSGFGVMGFGVWLHNLGKIYHSGASIFTTQPPTLSITPPNTFGCGTVTVNFCATGGETWILIGPRVSTDDVILDDLFLQEQCGGTGNCSSALNATITPANIPCNSQCTGSATANPSGGTSPYTYSWNTSPVQTTQTATGLCAGSYTVTVTDFVSATSTATVMLTQPALALTSTITSANLLCNAVCSGTSTVTPSGGTPGYTYNWSPSGGTAANATGLCAASYTCAITDANGCTTTQTVALTQPTALTVTTSVTQTGCTTGTGTATASPSGGTPGYSYSWTGGQTVSTATGLSAGAYTVTVTDNNGCTQTQTASVTSAGAPTAVLASQTNVLCNGAANGNATVTPSGGTPGYTYNWLPSGGTAATGTNLGAGAYTCTITDASGCSVTQTVTITEPAAITGTTSSTQTGCTTATGTATSNPSGGTPGYTYLWNNGQTASTATGLSIGTYTVTVTDANGCTQTQTVTVTQIAGGPTATASASIITIYLGDNTQLTATGGGTYLWSPAAGLSCTTCANPTATPNQTTTYCVFVTDANNCMDSACIKINVEIPCAEIFVPTAFSPNNDGANELECVMGDCIEEFHFAIYDRWGEKVFETNDQKICWDGTYKGKPMNTAEFVYFLKATTTKGETLIKEGSITLVR